MRIVVRGWQLETPDASGLPEAWGRTERVLEGDAVLQYLRARAGSILALRERED